MKKLIVLSVVMLVVLATAASAAFDTFWQVNLLVSDLNNMNAGVANIYGTATTTASSNQNPSGNVVYMFYTPNGTQYTFRKINAVESPPDPTVIHEWPLSIGTRPGWTGGSTFKLRVWNPTGTAFDLDDNWGGVTGTQPYIQPKKGPGWEPQNAFFVRLYKIYGESTPKLLWTFNPTTNGGSLTPEFSGVFGGITAGSIINNYFLLKREPIPEPGSIVALVTGAVGLAGFAIRRRR
ncbi:MAG: PEP-CTERM sorting domain-containing protein [Armatimonadetes bacterium]|nr:PEP-CTERM sorting domain-containing protein [Armatimonadota bacterium]